jgi:hypothetical protein
MRHRSSVFALAVSVFVAAAATPIAAQGTAADSAHWRATKADLDSIARDRSSPGYSKRAQARIRARDSLRAVPIVVQPTPIPTPPPADTTTPTPVPAPSPGTIAAHPYPTPANGAIFAALPRARVDTTTPSVTRIIRTTNLAAALDTARDGDEIRIPPGTRIANVTQGKPGTRAGWITVRTDVPDAAIAVPKMTRRLADSLNLATFVTSSTTPALWLYNGAHHIRFVAVKLEPAAPGAVVNALAWIGNNESDRAALPHHIGFDRVAFVGGSTDVRRCLRLDGADLFVVRSSLLGCHSNSSDSQGVLIINGAGPYEISGNTIQGGHMSLLVGGGDPSIRGMIPSDIVIRGNDLARPPSWRNRWQTKTNVELKIGRFVLIEGNEVCGTWPDAQSGYAVLLKTENQDGGVSGDWSETSDVTVRYNRICGAAGAFNLSAMPQGPGVPMARVSIYGNVADSVDAGIYDGDVGDALQLAGVNDVVFVDNWTRNPTGRSCLYVIAPSQRFVAARNVCGGEYGLNSAGGFATMAPGAILAPNTVLPWGTAFGAWPAVPANAARDAMLVGVADPVARAEAAAAPSATVRARSDVRIPVRKAQP